MAGVGGSYGDDIDQFAPNIRLYYFPNHKICLGPEVAYFPTVKEGELERELIEYNFSAHLIFNLTKRIAAFPAVGLNYSMETERELDIEKQESSLGLNLGGGIHLEYGRYFPYIEYKYVASNLPQNAFSIGVLINVGSGKNEDEEH